MDLLLKNVRIVNEEEIVEGSLAIKDKKIVGILSSDIEIPAREVKDLEGAIVTPGAVDSHVHIPKGPGHHRGDFFTEGCAALFGGTTTVIDFAKAGDVSLLKNFHDRCSEARKLAPLDFSFHAVIQEEDELALIPELHQEGLVSFKHIMANCNGCPGMKTDLQYRSFQALAKAGAMATVHAENEEIQAYLVDSMKRDGKRGPMAHAEARTVISEVEAISRAILLAEETGIPLHVFHISSAWGAFLVEEARKRGLPVTGETCPHYLHFTRQDIKEKGPFLQINPSIKFAVDREFLWENLKNGMLDNVVSDHYAPLKEEKEKGWQDIWSVEGGVPGIETRTLYLANEGVANGNLDWPAFVRLTSTNPAKIFGMYPEKGSIAPGAHADLVVWDDGPVEKLNCSALHQTADWTPFEGISIRFFPVQVYLRGKLVVQGDNFLGEKGEGQFIRRRKILG